MSIDDQHRPFAWAGLRLNVPAELRPFRVDGRYRRGNVGLADASQPRLELAWTLPKRRRFDPHRMLRHKLVRTMPPAHQRKADELISLVESEHFAPLWRYTDEQRNLDRCVGYARGTGRIVELIVHFYNDEHSDEALLRQATSTLYDQRLDAPQKWAFFGHRITAPTGFVFDDAELNIGDMSVRFRQYDRRQISLTVRLLYTAKLALQRRSMAKWIAAFHKADKFTGNNLYRLPGRDQIVRGDMVQTPLGEAMVCDSRLRRQVRSSAGKCPRGSATGSSMTPSATD